MLSRIQLPRALFLLLLALCCARGVAALSVREAAIVAHRNGNLLRLHILAHSNHPADQELKLAVRDALIPLLGAWGDEAADARAAEALVRQRSDQLVARAAEVVRAAGRDYPIRVELGEFPFPVKTSAAVTLPAGTYRAVRVVIGDGAGDNWWCVLFPPICSAQQKGVEAKAASAEELAGNARRQVVVRWRVMPRIVRTLQVSVHYLARYGAAEAHTVTD